MLCFPTANSAFSKATLFLAFICSVIVCSSGDRDAPQLPLKPVDCLLSEWSSWTRCDPCLKKRYRYATLSQPSEFGGESCDNNGRQVESCTPPSQYSCQRRAPLCQGFRCTTTGRCVLEDLRCNGDDDCGDGSDEQDCKKVQKACNQPTEEFYGIENLAKGVNIMTGKLEAVVLDNRYYAGGCLPHFIQDVRYRKPYNLQQYTIETKGSLDYKMEAFESKSEYLRSESKYTLSETSVSIGIKIPNVFEFGFKYNDHHYKKSAKKMRSNSGMRNKYVRVYSELEVARYALKSSNLMLHPEFLSRLNALPLEYTYGEYRQLYNDYGTHFVKEATLGGNFDYTLIINEEKLEKEGYKLSDDKDCVNAGVKLGANIEGVYVSGGLSGGSCQSLLKESGELKKTRDFLEDVIIVVRGGDSESVSRLAAKKLPDPSDMQLWGDAIFYNPEFLNRKLEPLFELVTGQDFSSASILKKNLRRALAEYMREVSSCQCSPCLNNGAPVLKGTRCVCVCPPGFKGVSCEITQRKTLAVDASWSCWSSWSTCTGRTRQRTRQCDNPPPTGGGMTCLGPQNESEDCI